MPDRVPLKRRGTVRALSGIGLMVGTLGGQVLGSVFLGSISAGYMVLRCSRSSSSPSSSSSTPTTPEGARARALQVRRLPAHVLGQPGQAPRLLLGVHRTPAALHGLLRRHRVPVLPPHRLLRHRRPRLGHSRARAHQPRRHPDLHHPSGPLSDKFGRRKPFVFASSARPGVAFSSRGSGPTSARWMIMTFIAGFGFGMFQAVDTALMSEVLPSAKSFAKDLGVVNIAATLPQALAPGDRRRDRAHLRLHRPVPGRHRALHPRRLRRPAHQVLPLTPAQAAAMTRMNEMSTTQVRTALFRPRSTRSSRRPSTCRTGSRTCSGTGSTSTGHTIWPRPRR